MLVYLHQYKHEEVQFDDNRTTGESQTEDSVDTDPESYFGGQVDLEAATWETVESDGDPIQRRELTLDGVTAVSAPEDDDGGDPDLPGRTIQVRMDADVEAFDNAVIVEAEDATPQ